MTLVLGLVGCGGGNTTTVVEAPDVAEERRKPVVIVPRVLGERDQFAHRQLQRSGFEVRITYRHSERSRGSIISQHPRPGARARKGQLVTLQASGGPEPPGPAGQASAAPASPEGPTAFLQDLSLQPRERPFRIIYTNHHFVDDITWSAWGGETASGQGTANVNTCKPYCAAGSYEEYPVAITLSALDPCGDDYGYYTEMSLSFTAEAPKGHSTVFRFESPC